MTDRVLLDPNIPAPFRNTLFDDYDTSRRRGNKRILRLVDEWTPTVARPALLLQGTPGLGKTMLASALLNEYHTGYVPSERSDAQAVRNLPASAMTVLLQEKCPVYFIQLAELIGFHLRTFKLHDLVMRGLTDPAEYLEIDQLLQDLKTRVKVLVIDDVGKEHHTSTGFAEDEFDLLVRTRHNAGLTTIYTTNLPLNRWGTQYSQSMQSLIERSSTVVDFF